MTDTNKTNEEILEEANRLPFPAAVEGDILSMYGVRMVYTSSNTWILESSTE